MVCRIAMSYVVWWWGVGCGVVLWYDVLVLGCCVMCSYVWCCDVWCCVVMWCVIVCCVDVHDVVLCCYV